MHRECIKILSEWNLSEKDLTNLEQEFRTDDHRYWESKKPDQKPNPMLSANGGRSMMESRRIWKPFPRKQVEADGDFLGADKNREQKQV